MRGARCYAASRRRVEEVSFSRGCRGSCGPGFLGAVVLKMTLWDPRAHPYEEVAYEVYKMEDI